MTESQIKKCTVLNERIDEVIETHISWLLVTREHVYKMKKTVKYSFLDFSTLEKRKHFCEEELHLNNRLTEGMYLEVVPITQENDYFFIGKKTGEIVDYAIKMKRIEASQQMHLLLEKNKVTKKDIERIAQQLIPFHQNAKIITRPLPVSEMKETFNDIRSVQDFVTRKLGVTANKTIKKSIEFSDHFIDKNAHLLEERIQRGMIRDVHGDLHSSNIFIDKKPIIFDCIEFNPKFREIDILNELAFFCLDLDAYDHEDFGIFFIKKYRELFPEVLQSDFDEQLLRYYKLYRANVRAKVKALKAREMPDGKKREKTHIEDLKLYLKLMEKYLQKMPLKNSPQVI